MLVEFGELGQVKDYLSCFIGRQLVISFCWMETYSYLDGILTKRDSSYLQFEKEITTLRVEQQTYLNLFLVTVATHKATSAEFEKYIHLLTHFKEVTGKKSADVNYIGYKDRKNILMHAAQRGTPHAVEVLLNYKVQPEVTDPSGRNAAFYAVRNQNQEHSNAILGLLINRHPKLLTMEALNGATLLNEAIDRLRTSTIDLLLRKGANPNTKLKDSGNTVSHQLMKHSQNNREVVLGILLLLAKYKANFQEPNLEGQTVSDRAMKDGINLQDYTSFCALLQKDESVVEETDNQFDKISLTTLNQITKGGDTRSEIEQSDSHQLSGRVDFSELDELNPNEPLEPSEVMSLSDLEELNISDEFSQPEEINYAELSQEILGFSREQEQIHLNMVPLAQQFLGIIDRMAAKYQLALKVVGSFATGLWSPRSDINISLFPKTGDFLNFESTLQKLYKVLKPRKQQLQIVDIHFVKSKVSSIKVTLGEKMCYQMFDIAIFHRNHLNQQYTTYILESLAAFPEIKPLFFVYLKMCKTFGLDDPQAGGVKTYALFMMVSSVVKSMPTKNVGELFFHVALYYGFYFEFGFDLETAQPQKYEYLQQYIKQALECPRMKLNLIDPFNHKNNIGGKNTKAKQLQNMFRAIYYWLNQPADPPYLPQLFSLSLLF